MIVGSWEQQIPTLMGQIVSSACLLRKSVQQIAVPQAVGSSRVGVISHVFFLNLVPWTLVYVASFLTEFAAPLVPGKAVPDARELGRDGALGETHRPLPATPSP